MPSMLCSSICLEGIPRLGTSCPKPWDKVSQALGQVIESIPLFEPLNFTLFSFQFLTSSKSLTLDRLSSKFGLYSLKRDFQFFAKTCNLLTQHPSPCQEFKGDKVRGKKKRTKKALRRNAPQDSVYNY